MICFDRLYKNAIVTCGQVSWLPVGSLRVHEQIHSCNPRAHLQRCAGLNQCWHPHRNQVSSKTFLHFDLRGCCLIAITWAAFFRLVLSRFEIETATNGESPVEAEDEEEVWLFWKNGFKEIKSKSIRELAQDAKEGQKEDQEVVSYYRSKID